MIWVLTPILIYLYGYNGVSVASFLVTTTIVYTIYLVKKIVRFSFIKSIYKPMFATILMIVLVYVSLEIFVKDALSLIFVILIGVLVYIVSLLILARKELGRDIVRFGIKI